MKHTAMRLLGLGAVSQEDFLAYDEARAQVYQNVMAAIDALRASDVSARADSEDILRQSYAVKDRLDALHVEATQGQIRDGAVLLDETRQLNEYAIGLRQEAEAIARINDAAFESTMVWVLVGVGAAAIVGALALTARA